MDKCQTLAILVLLIAAAPIESVAQFQEYGELRGVVIDRRTRLPIDRANVYSQDVGTWAITDTLGRFRIRVPVGRSIQIVFSHVSYDKLVKDYKVTRTGTIYLEITLQGKVVRSDEVTITGRRPFTEQSARFIISGLEIQECGEVDMEHKLRYLLTGFIRSHETRMVNPDLDFTLYVNGRWVESYHLNEIDPADVKRILVWTDSRWSPVGFSVIRGSCTINIETTQRAPH